MSEGESHSLKERNLGQRVVARALLGPPNKSVLNDTRYVESIPGLEKVYRSAWR